MASSYEDRMAQKYKFLKKDSAEILSKEQEKESVAEEDSNSETTNNLSTTEESLLVPLDAWNTEDSIKLNACLPSLALPTTCKSGSKSSSADSAPSNMP